MKILNGNIFEVCKTGDAICVTTNGIINKFGNLIMGAGVAKEFRDKFKGIDSYLGKCVSEYGNQAFWAGTGVLGNEKVELFSFPTKQNWKDKSDLKLIERSCIQLKNLVKEIDIKGNIYLPAPGCSNGGLDWENEVKPIVERHLIEECYFICFYK